MVLFPNCKINLGLHIVAKRTDGYHNLETIFYPVGVSDALEVIKSDETTFHLTGLDVAGNAQDNLCVKAYHLLRQDFLALPPVRIHLHKAIPMGAGLGGGSADGAVMLLLLNKKFELNLNETQLINYALQLGSDCPFFIVNKPCYAKGRGEIMTLIEMDLTAYKLVLVNPQIHVSTKDAFARLSSAKSAKSLREIIQQPLPTWKEELRNDFEDGISKLYPVIDEIKQSFYKAGAVYAAMTGSGSTVYGFFEKGMEVNFSFPKNYFVATVHNHG